MAEKQHNSSDGGDIELGPRHLSSEETTSSQEEELRKNIARSPQMLNVEDAGNIHPHQPIVFEKTVGGILDETTTNTAKEHNSSDGGGMELGPRNSSSGEATPYVEANQDEEPWIGMARPPKNLNKDAPGILSQPPTPTDAVFGPFNSAGTTSEVKVDDAGEIRSSANMEHIDFGEPSGNARPLYPLHHYLTHALLLQFQMQAREKALRHAIPVSEESVVCGDLDGTKKIEPPLPESSHNSTAVHGLPSTVDLTTPANKSNKDLENSQIFIAATKSSSPPGMVPTPTKRLLSDHNAGDDQNETPLKRSTTDLSLKGLDHDHDYL